MRLHVGILAAIAFAMTSCSSAPHTAFNRPNTEYTQYQQDVESCQKIINGTDVDIANPDGTAGGALVAGFFSGMEEGRAKRKNFNNCMVSRGYTLMEISEEEYRAFAKMRDEDKDIKRAEWLKRDLPATKP
jgi:hypothetical protein